MPYTNLWKTIALAPFWGAGAPSAMPLGFGLSSTKPNELGGNITPPSGGGYADKTALSSNFTIRNVGNVVWVDNDSPIVFPTATGDWGTFGFWTMRGLAFGNQLFEWGYIDDGLGNPTTKTILSGDDFNFPAQQLRMYLVLPPSEVP